MIQTSFRTILTFLVFFFYLDSSAQIEKEFLNLHNKYKNIDTLSVFMNMQVFYTNNLSNTKSDLALYKLKNIFLYKIDKNLILSTPEMDLFINNDLKQIHVTNKTKDKNSSNPNVNFNIFEVDSILKKCKSISGPNINGSSKTYCMISDNLPIYNTCVTIDTVTSFLTYVSYDYKEIVNSIKRVEISIKNSNVMLVKNEMNINYYVQSVSKNKYIPTKKYMHYEIITN
ncbi:MAG: hypothetical protein CVU05_01950 [Bacteroidetes bacterium HGW-Bacteroidetes-21]|jgi:hypothetical protein|nr:MAG: hypothetical protein CVU05_01950 [Bacteroidetes bacterium HGW-Bacteroidetes-21]